MAVAGSNRKSGIRFCENVLVPRAFGEIGDTLQGAGGDEKCPEQAHHNNGEDPNQQIEASIAGAGRTGVGFVIGQRLFVQMGHDG